MFQIFLWIIYTLEILQHFDTENIHEDLLQFIIFMTILTIFVWPKFPNIPKSKNIPKIKTNTQVDIGKVVVIVMPIYSLIEYCDNYSKRSGRL